MEHLQSTIGKHYRFYPIILGFRARGYELQEQRKNIFGLKRWFPVKGEHGKEIRVIQSDRETLEQIKDDLLKLANHLNAAEYFVITKTKPNE